MAFWGTNTSITIRQFKHNTVNKIGILFIKYNFKVVFLQLNPDIFVLNGHRARNTRFSG